MTPHAANVAIRYMPGHGGAESILPAVQAALEARGCRVTSLTVPKSDTGLRPDKLEAALDLLRQQQLIISLGGDGTLLSTARLVAGEGIPILGLNLKGLGFLTATTAENYAEALDAFFADRMKIEERRMLQVRYSDAEAEGLTEYPFAALNDIAIVRGIPTRMVQLEIHLDGTLLTSIEADGVIVSTPSGSTAYNLAGGGSILWPELDVLAVTPVMPHALTIRPIVVPAQTVIEIRGVPTSRSAPHLAVDGQTVSMDETRPIVQVTRSPKTTLLARMPGTHFGTVLREKLVWGGHLRELEDTGE